MPVTVNAAAIAEGKGVYRNGEIIISANALNEDDNGLGTIVHEIQHAIQEIEGFASGGNPGMFSFVVDERAVESAREKFHSILGDKKLEDRFFEIEGIRKEAQKRRERVDGLNREIEKLDLDDESVAMGTKSCSRLRLRPRNCTETPSNRSNTSRTPCGAISATMLTAKLTARITRGR